MSEQEISAISAVAISLGSAVMAILFMSLYALAGKYDSPTKFGRAIRRKYLAMAVLFVILSLLHSYTAYFNIAGEVGWFTFPVRTTLRWSGVFAIGVAVSAMTSMIIQYIRAGKE